jgi:hypothetical protein
MLILKVVISVGFVVLEEGTFAIVLMVCLVLNLVIAFFLPPYFFPISNLLWAGLQSSLVYGAIVLIFLVNIGNSGHEGVSNFFVVYACGMIPVAIVGSAAFFYRMHRLLRGLNIWSHTMSASCMKRKQTVRKGEKYDAKEEIATLVAASAAKVAPAEIIKRCNLAIEVSIASNALFALAGKKLRSYLIELLGRGVKKFPDDEHLVQNWIAISAQYSDNSVMEKAQIQTSIRKALLRHTCSLDTRFGFFTIIKV